MTWPTLTRKRLILAAAVLIVLGIAVSITHVGLTRAAAGPLRHDDTLHTTKVDKTWQVTRPKLERCLEIRFKGTVAGNARPTWGLGGRTTVWENLRLDIGSISVQAQRLGADGTCQGSATMEKVIVAGAWKTGDAKWRGYRQTRVTSGKGSSAWNGYADTKVRLDGGAYDRGDSYRTTLAVYAEPYWRKGGMSISDGVHVEHAVELPVD